MTVPNNVLSTITDFDSVLASKLDGCERHFYDRLKTGKKREWRAGKVIEENLIAEGHDAKMYPPGNTDAECKQADIDGTDAIFVIDGVTTRDQLKTRDDDNKDKIYCDLGFETILPFFARLEDFDVLDGRDMKPYDFFSCMAWSEAKLGNGILYRVNGPYVKSAIIRPVIAEFKQYIVGIYKDIGCGPQGLMDPFNSRFMKGVQLRHVVDRGNDRRGNTRKLITYVQPKIIPARYLQQWPVTPKQLAYILGD